VILYSEELPDSIRENVGDVRLRPVHCINPIKHHDLWQDDKIAPPGQSAPARACLAAGRNNNTNRPRRCADAAKRLNI